MLRGAAWKTLTLAPNTSKLRFLLRRSGKQVTAWRTGTSRVTSCQHVSFASCCLSRHRIAFPTISPLNMTNWNPDLTLSDKFWRWWQQQGRRSRRSWPTPSTTTQSECSSAPDDPHSHWDAGGVKLVQCQMLKLGVCLHLEICGMWVFARRCGGIHSLVNILINYWFYPWAEKYKYTKWK